MSDKPKLTVGAVGHSTWDPTTEWVFDYYWEFNPALWEKVED